jgi:hypothetical protein
MRRYCLICRFVHAVSPADHCPNCGARARFSVETVMPLSTMSPKENRSGFVFGPAAGSCVTDLRG